MGKHWENMIIWGECSKCGEKWPVAKKETV